MISEIEQIQENSEANSVDEVLFRVVTFTLNSQLYALNILDIRDIVMGKIIYRIPNSIKELVGVTNIRGEILPVYSLKKILGLEEKLDTEQYPVVVDIKDDEYLIIIKSEGLLMAIIVDYIDKNISVTQEHYNDGVYMSKWSKDNVFSGVIVDQEDNILLIDVKSLIKYISGKNN